MGNLSALLPKESATVNAIYELHAKEARAESRRGYLGASIIGHECDRYLWYSFRQCFRDIPDGRLHRLFETGHLAEARFVRELRGIGCKVYDKDESDNQVEVSACDGHFKGHVDALCLGLPEAPKTWHVCEFKTHNADSFAKLQAQGVEKAKPMHYTQMQVYMALLDLDRALYLAVNKDTDELCAERIEYNGKFAKATLARAQRIIEATDAPDRMTTRQDDFRCKWCPASALCWGTAPVAVSLPEKNCRTCCHSKVELNGKWSCKVSTFGTPCKQHLLLPTFIRWAEAVDATDTTIVFQNSDDTKWTHGDGSDGTWSTDELMSQPVALIGQPRITKAKQVFEGIVIDPVKSLVDAYPKSDVRHIWHGTIGDIETGIASHKGLSMATKMGVTRHEKGALREAYEYAGRYLIVIESGMADIYEGVE